MWSFTLIDKHKFNIFSTIWKKKHHNHKSQIFNVIIPCFLTASVIYSFVYYMNKNNKNNNNSNLNYSIISNSGKHNTTNNKTIDYIKSDVKIAVDDNYVMAWYNPR